MVKRLVTMAAIAVLSEEPFVQSFLLAVVFFGSAMLTVGVVNSGWSRIGSSRERRIV